MGLSAAAISAPVRAVFVCRHRHWTRLRPPADAYWTHLSGGSPGRGEWDTGYAPGAGPLVAHRVLDPPRECGVRGGSAGWSGPDSGTALVAPAGAVPL